MNDEERKAYDAFQRIVDAAKKMNEAINGDNQKKPSVKMDRDSIQSKTKVEMKMTEDDDDIQTEFFCDLSLSIWLTTIMEFKLQFSPGFSNQVTVCFESKQEIEVDVLWDEISNEGICDYASLREDGSITLGISYASPKELGPSYQAFVEMLWMLSIRGFRPTCAMTQYGNCQEFQSRLTEYMEKIATVKQSSDLDISQLFGFIF